MWQVLRGSVGRMGLGNEGVGASPGSVFQQRLEHMTQARSAVKEALDAGKGKSGDELTAATTAATTKVQQTLDTVSHETGLDFKGVTAANGRTLEQALARQDFASVAEIVEKVMGAKQVELQASVDRLKALSPTAAREVVEAEKGQVDKLIEQRNDLATQTVDAHAEVDSLRQNLKEGVVANSYNAIEDQINGRLLRAIENEPDDAKRAVLKEKYDAVLVALENAKKGEDPGELLDALNALAQADPQNRELASSVAAVKDTKVELHGFLGDWTAIDHSLGELEKAIATAKTLDAQVDTVDARLQPEQDELKSAELYQQLADKDKELLEAKRNVRSADWSKTDKDMDVISHRLNLVSKQDKPKAKELQDQLAAAKREHDPAKMLKALEAIKMAWPSDAKLGRDIDTLDAKIRGTEGGGTTVAQLLQLQDERDAIQERVNNPAEYTRSPAPTEAEEPVKPPEAEHLTPEQQMLKETRDKAKEFKDKLAGEPAAFMAMNPPERRAYLDGPGKENLAVIQGNADALETQSKAHPEDAALKQVAADARAVATAAAADFARLQELNRAARPERRPQDPEDPSVRRNPPPDPDPSVRRDPARVDPPADVPADNQAPAGPYGQQMTAANQALQAGDYGKAMQALRQALTQASTPEEKTKVYQAMSQAHLGLRSAPGIHEDFNHLIELVPAEPKAAHDQQAAALQAQRDDMLAIIRGVPRREARREDYATQSAAITGLVSQADTETDALEAKAGRAAALVTETKQLIADGKLTEAEAKLAELRQLQEELRHAPDKGLKALQGQLERVNGMESRFKNDPDWVADKAQLEAGVADIQGRRGKVETDIAGQVSELERLLAGSSRDRLIARGQALEKEIHEAAPDQLRSAVDVEKNVLPAYRAPLSAEGIAQARSDWAKFKGEVDGTARKAAELKELAAQHPDIQELQDAAARAAGEADELAREFARIDGLVRGRLNEVDKRSREIEQAEAKGRELRKQLGELGTSVDYAASHLVEEGVFDKDITQESTEHVFRQARQLIDRAKELSELARANPESEELQKLADEARSLATKANVTASGAAMKYFESHNAAFLDGNDERQAALRQHGAWLDELLEKHYKPFAEADNARLEALRTAAK